MAKRDLGERRRERDDALRHAAHAAGARSGLHATAATAQRPRPPNRKRV
jgi:hypothetical protein